MLRPEVLVVKDYKSLEKNVIARQDSCIHFRYYENGSNYRASVLVLYNRKTKTYTVQKEAYFKKKINALTKKDLVDKLYKELTKMGMWIKKEDALKSLDLG